MAPSRFFGGYGEKTAIAIYGHCAMQFVYDPKSCILLPFKENPIQPQNITVYFLLVFWALNVIYFFEIPAFFNSVSFDLISLRR